MMKLKKINNCEIKIDQVDIEENPIRHGFILTARGWSTPKFHYLEEIKEDSYVISGSDIGKRVGYRMEIPMDILYNHDFRHLQEYIYNCIPPELCNGYNEEKIIEKCWDFFYKRFY